MAKQVLLSKLDTLDFIQKRRMVSIHDLVDSYGYSYWGAFNKLRRLRQQQLIALVGRGIYTLTEEGYRRLRYHGRR